MDAPVECPLFFEHRIDYVSSWRVFTPQNEYIAE